MGPVSLRPRSLDDRPAGQQFFYNTGALRLVSAIIRKARGRALDEFARATLFEPLGITSAEWAAALGAEAVGSKRHCCATYMKSA